MSELELSISKSYEVRDFRLIAGKLTEDIPVFVKERGGTQAIDIFVDVRHPEVAKLKELGFTQILYSLIGYFLPRVSRAFPQEMESTIFSVMGHLILNYLPSGGLNCGCS